MKTSWALPRWASNGVAAVIKPQAEADSRMTFSPPILEGRQEDSDGDGGAGQPDQKILPRRHVARGLAIPLRSTLCGGTAAVYPSAEAEGESAGSSLVSAPQTPRALSGTPGRARCHPLPAVPCGSRVSQLPLLGQGLSPLGSQEPPPLCSPPPRAAPAAQPGEGAVTGPPGGRPRSVSGSSPRRSC